MTSTVSTTTRTLPGTAPQTLGVAFVFAAAASAGVLWHFHDAFWYAADEGIHAHIAERMFNGEVLHRDIQDIHAGYIHFANMLAFKLFGMNLLSLRYPLVLMGMAQAALIFFLFARHGAIMATTAAFSLTALSTVQFLNPTAHWYCLFLLIFIVWIFSVVPMGMRGRMEAIGFLIMTLFLFRQLSGVLVGMGAVCYLLYELQVSGRMPMRRAGSWVARLVVIVSAAGLGWYLLTKTDFLGLVLFGIWPLGLLVITAYRLNVSDGTALRLLGRLAIGGCIAAAPLIAYQASHGSLVAWFNDSFFSALSLTRLEFISQASYGWLIHGGLVGVLKPSGFNTIANGAFWIILSLVASINGCFVLWGLLQDRPKSAVMQPLPFLTVFYAVVSVHFQIPIYLTYTAGLSLVSLLWISSSATAQRAGATACVAIALSMIGLYYNAAQPLGRGPLGIVEGHRIANDAACPSPRCGLRISQEEAERLRDLLALIARHTRKGDPIFAIPVNPELYFLSGRSNPFPFFSTAFGLRDEEAVSRVIAALDSDRPSLVFTKPKDKYVTPRSLEVIDAVRQRYELIENLHGFEVYRRRNADPDAGRTPTGSSP